MDNEEEISVSKRSWKKFKMGFEDPTVKKKLLWLAVLVILFILNLCYYQYQRMEGLKDLLQLMGTVYIQGVLGVFP